MTDALFNSFPPTAKLTLLEDILPSDPLYAAVAVLKGAISTSVRRPRGNERNRTSRPFRHTNHFKRRPEKMMIVMTISREAKMLIREAFVLVFVFCGFCGFLLSTTNFL